MTSEQQEGNIAIAKFMGYVIKWYSKNVPHEIGHGINRTNDIGDDYVFEHPSDQSKNFIIPEYHSDSNWQDQVLKKISELGYSWVMGYNMEDKFHWAAIFTGMDYYRNKIESIQGATDQPKNEVVFNLLVKFVDWYNGQNKKSCEHKHTTFNNDIGAFVCDDCNNRV